MAGRASRTASSSARRGTGAHGPAALSPWTLPTPVGCLFLAAWLGGCDESKRRFWAPCERHAECASGLCYEGHCTTSCLTDAECGGEVCVAKRCQPRSSPMPDASADSKPACEPGMYERIGGTCADLRQWAQWPIPPVSPPDSQYVVEAAAGTVKDTVTGLEWQRAVDPGENTWADAKALCVGLSLAGGGWRLPSRIELLSLVDYAKIQPSINAAAFPSTPGQWFWSSTVAVGTRSPAAWTISFYNGATAYDDLAKPYRVRCVR